MDEVEEIKKVFEKIVNIIEAAKERQTVEKLYFLKVFELRNGGLMRFLLYKYFKNSYYSTV